MVYDSLTKSSFFWTLSLVKNKRKHESFVSRLCILLQARKASNLADPLDGTIQSLGGDWEQRCVRNTPSWMLLYLKTETELASETCFLIQIMDKFQKNETVSLKILGVRISSQQIRRRRRRLIQVIIDYTTDKTLYRGSCRYFQTLWKVMNVQFMFTQ